MSTYNHLNNLYSSLILVAQTVRQEVITQGVSPNIEFMNIDAHSTLPEWPDVDVMGIGAVSVEVADVANLSGSCAFFCSTVNDPNLFRHMEIMNRMFDRLIPMTNHPMVHSVTGHHIGSLTVEGGTQLMRMERTESRPIQYILASFQTTLTYSPI